MGGIPDSFDPAEYLAEARGHLERNPHIPERHYSLRLLAAAAAGQKLVADWEAKATRATDAMADAADDPEMASDLASWAQAHSACAEALREAISGALLGER